MNKIKITNDNKVIEEKTYDNHLLEQYMNDYAKAVETIIKYAYNNAEIFKASNIVGEYAELLACEALNLTKVGASAPEYDAVLNGKKYQIKSRWFNSFGSGHGKSEFGSITESVINNVDYLVLVVFLGNNFTNVKIYEIVTKDILKIRGAFEKGLIAHSIVSKKLKGNKYKLYYHDIGFDQAIKLGFIKEIR